MMADLTGFMSFFRLFIVNDGLCVSRELLGALGLAAVCLCARWISGCNLLISAGSSAVNSCRSDWRTRRRSLPENKDARTRKQAMMSPLVNPPTSELCSGLRMGRIVILGNPFP